MFKFTIPGMPHGKARARTFYNAKLKHMQSITPETTVLYENLVKTSFWDATNGENVGYMDGEPLSVKIIAYFPIPKSLNKSKKEAAARGDLCPTVRPDVDNIAKCVLDALNGIAYGDDKQIAELHIKKIFTDNGPKVTVSCRAVYEQGE